MADYYPLISRAIAGLDPHAPGESRRALYERARTALVSRLRSAQPPLTESEITGERLAFEDAVLLVPINFIRCVVLRLLVLGRLARGAGTIFAAVFRKDHSLAPQSLVRRSRGISSGVIEPPAQSLR